MPDYKTLKLRLQLMVSILALSIVIIAAIGISQARSEPESAQPMPIGNAPDDIHPTPEEILLEKGMSLTVPDLIATLKNENEKRKFVLGCDCFRENGRLIGISSSYRDFKE